MYEGMQRDDWDHTSQIVAIVANVNRSPHTPPVNPLKLNPFRQHKSKLSPEAEAAAAEIDKQTLKAYWTRRAEQRGNNV